MDFRPIDWSRDSTAIRSLDTSFVTDRIFAIRRIGLSFELVDEPCESPFVKHYMVSLTEGTVSSALVTLAACENGTLRGFAVVTDQAWNHRAVISDFYIDRQFRRRGLGKGMMNEVCRQLLANSPRTLWVETQNVNLPAVEFYLGIGFELCGWDSTLYPEPHAAEVAIFLSKNI
jgi:ribosomal protein S18 acetylase RimI-like enzyme